MKPFSKNLFSQTPVAFGWLPKETINLDISVCVCVYFCVSMRGHAFCVLLINEWENFYFYFFFAALFYQSHIQVCAKADQVEKGRSAKKLNNTTHGANNPPRIFATKTQHPPLSHIPPSPDIILHLQPNSLPKCHPKTSFCVNTSPPLPSITFKFRLLPAESLGRS